jgi:hypothetical protein
MSDLYVELTDEFARMKTYREIHVEKRMKENVELIVPKYGIFNPDPIWEDKRYDSIGTECAWLLAEGMFGNHCPANEPWFRYVEVGSNANSANNKYLEKLSEFMMEVFNRSTFYDIGPETTLVGATMPCASVDIHEDKNDNRIICSLEHPRAVYAKTNAWGQVDTVYVREYYTGEQAAGIWDELDPVVQKSADDGDDTTYEFLEIVKKREKYDNQSKFPKEWMYGEYTIRTGDTTQKIYEETGCKEFPKPTWRWSTRGHEPYAWTPSDDAMPDIRTCHQMVRTMLTTYQANADPARVLPDEARSWSTNPGAKNFARDMNRKAYTLEPGNARYENDMMLALRERVKQAYKVNHFLMLMQQEREMTAREVLERKRESMSVTSSVSGKYQTELLDRLHRRFLDIEMSAKRAPPPPQGLKTFKIEYRGPIAQLQRQVFIQQGIIGSMETLLPLYTFAPWQSGSDKLKIQVITDKVWEANAAPKEALRDNDEWTKIQQDKAEAAAKAQDRLMKQETAKGIDPNVKPAEGSPAQAMVGGMVGPGKKR